MMVEAIERAELGTQLPDIKAIDLHQTIPTGCGGYGGAVMQSGDATLDLLNQSAEIANDSYTFQSATYGDNFHDWSVVVLFKSVVLHGSWVCYQPCQNYPPARFTGTNATTVSNAVVAVTVVVGSDLRVQSISAISVSLEKVSIAVKADGAKKDIEDWINIAINTPTLISLLETLISTHANSGPVRSAVKDALNSLLSKP